jgi:hypothetical protein
MEKRYKALRIVASLMKGTGILIAVLSILGALSLCGAITSGGMVFDRMFREFGQSSSGLGVFTGLVGGLFAGVFPVVFGGSFALLMYAGGEAVNLQIAIEENTRSMTWYFQYSGRSALGASLPMQPALQSASAALSQTGPGAPNALPVPTPTQTPKERNFCPQCGTKIQPADEQCANCGHELA